jgi:hypothetical protein
MSTNRKETLDAIMRAMEMEKEVEHLRVIREKYDAVKGK